MVIQQELSKRGQSEDTFFRRKWIEIIIFALLVVLGNRVSLSIHIFAVVFVSVCMLKSGIEDAFCWSLLLIPNIRVFDSLGYTFIINILLAVPLLVYFFRRRLSQIYKPVLGAVVLFVLELLHELVLGNTNEVVNLIAWTLNFVLCITITMDCTIQIKKENVFSALATGVILSAGMYMISKGITVFEMVSSMNTGSRLYAYANDPNYYSLYICLAIAYIICIDGKTIIRIAMLLLLTGVGLLTASKMCMIMMLLEYAVFFLQLLKQDKVGRKNRKFVFYLFFVSCLVALLLSDYITMVVENFVRRMGLATGGVADLNRITTGRLDIVSEYIDILSKNIKCFIFGYGFSYNNFLGQTTGHVAHNTYLDIILSWGMSGVIIFIIVIYCWLYSYCKVRNIQRVRMTTMLPVFILLLGFLALSCLSAGMFPFVVTIAIVSWLPQRKDLIENKRSVT